MSNKLWYGVVESRADPLKLGRCKVRIVGIHTENTSILPTKDLPWAIPVNPITSATVSGIGQAPVGPVEGTWVVCMFRDEGSYQEPLMLGTLAGIPEDKEVTFQDPYKGTAGTRYEGLKDVESSATSDQSLDDVVYDKYGNPVLDSEGNLVRKPNVLRQTSGVFTPRQEVEQGTYKIGTITAKHHGKPPTTIQTDKFAGSLYGKYQLPSYMNNGSPTSVNSADSPVLQFVSTSKYRDEFVGLVPGTPAFDEKWREVASKDPKGFEEAQDDFAKSKYQSPVINKLQAQGIDLADRGPAVHETVFSTGVQYGDKKATEIIARSLAGKDVNAMTDAEIVSAIQDDKKKNIKQDYKTKPEKWQDLEKSIEAEKADLVELAGDDTKFTKDQILRFREMNGEVEYVERNGVKVKEIKKGIELTPIPSSGIVPPRTIPENDKPGFQDPNGIYPRENWVGEPDVSRLARNEKTEKTILRAKRESLVRNVISAGGVNWSEPPSAYNAIYPLNHVTESESGHVFEMDDTPGAERIHVYHRKGSFIEFHPDGSVVYKSAKDQYEITISDRNVYVGGNCNVTVLGDANIYSKGKMNLESDGDMTIKTKANLRLGAEGRCFIESNGDMHIGSTSVFHAAGSNILLNCSWRSGKVTAGNYQIEKINVQVYDDEETTPIPTEIQEQSELVILRKQGHVPQEGKLPKKEEARDMDDVPKGEVDTTEVIIDSRMHPQDKISKNYSLADLTTNTELGGPEVVAQNGLTEEEIIENLSNLSKHVLEPLRSVYGTEFVITSGFRKGTSKSQHNKGQAVDIKFPDIDKSEGPHRAEEIARVLEEFDQIILEYHGTSGPIFHISYSKDRNRNQKLTTPNPKTGKYFSGFRDIGMRTVYS